MCNKLCQIQLKRTNLNQFNYIWKYITRKKKKPLIIKVNLKRLIILCEFKAWIRINPAENTAEKYSYFFKCT